MIVISYTVLFFYIFFRKQKKQHGFLVVKVANISYQAAKTKTRKEIFNKTKKYQLPYF